MTDRKKKILLVEDDWFTRFMMQEIRDTLGVEIDITASIHDGLTRFRSDPQAYGVVLMDVDLPEQQDAGQPFHDIQDMGQGPVPIIAVCADGQDPDHGLLRSRGMSGHLRKPLTPGELMALIDRYC